MKQYTFSFYPNGQLAQLSVITETRAEAADLVRTMIPDQFLDDGLFLNNEEDYD